MSDGPDGRQVPAPQTAATGAIVALALTLIIVLALDILTKYLVVAKLSAHPPVRLLGGAVYLILTRNAGAAFSFGTHLTFVYPVVAIVVAGWIGWMARRLRSIPWALAFGLVLGGAFGNLVDRLFRAPGFMVGHVVDFISVFSDSGRYFPIFNVADSALTCGVILAILLELVGWRRDGSRPKRSRDGSEPAVEPGSRPA